MAENWASDECVYCSEYAPGVKCEYADTCDRAVAMRRKECRNGCSQRDVLEWMRRAIAADDRARRR